MSKTKPIERLSSYLLMGLPILYALVIYSQLPAQLAIHFSPSSRVNSQMSKPVFLIGSLLLGLLAQGLVDWSLTRPGRVTNASFAHVIRWLLPLGWSLVTLAILWRNLNHDFPIAALSLYVVGALLLIISNYLPKQVQAGRKPAPRALAYALMAISLAILVWATFLI